MYTSNERTSPKRRAKRRVSHLVGTCVCFLVFPSNVRTRVDVLYPVRGFKRYVDEADGYEFRYPKVGVC